MSALDPLREHVNADDRESIPFLDPDKPHPILDAMEASAAEIRIREINRFHLALLDRCLERLPEQQKQTLSVHYQGILAKENSRKQKWTVLEGSGVRMGAGFRVHGDYGQPLAWTVQDQDTGGLFHLWVSISKTAQTVTECVVGEKTLHVNVSGVATSPGIMRTFSNREDAAELLNLSRPQLGGQSIVEFLSLLKEKNPEYEE